MIEHPALVLFLLTLAVSVALSVPVPGSSLNLAGTFACTFEQSGLCTWTQDRSDDFDWTRFRHSTASVGTGPSSDHTSGEGYYMYIETSAPRVKGDKARLISGSVTTTGQECLSFFYQMYGRTIGSLNVYILTDVMQKVWSRSGDQGQMWMNGYFNLPQDKTFKVVLEGVRGGGYQGDIAIDDIGVTPGTCNSSVNSEVELEETPEEEDSVTGQLSAISKSLACTFESSGICAWTQDTTDQFNWSRNKGHTASIYTGPDGDHTFGTGSYMYIESSAPRRQGDKARLISGSVTTNDQQCLSFFYHMYGSGIGSLNVYTLTDVMQQVWSRSGNQGNMWMNGYFNLPQNNTFKVVFEGVVGRSYMGDIAVDDISISPGSCSASIVNSEEELEEMPEAEDSVPQQLSAISQSLACTFESSGICMWTQDRTDQFDWTRNTGSTSSFSTGPTGDHTSGTGSYMYIESSSPRRQGDKARLISGSVTTTDQQCLSFFYHMYGSGIGSLNVYILTDVMQQVWSRSGNQGNMWMDGYFNLPQNNTFKVVFEGVRGTSYLGDIAVDDISISPGSCSASIGTGVKPQGPVR